MYIMVILIFLLDFILLNIMPKQRRIKDIKFGAFTDLASFRAETGLTAEEVPDADVWAAINGDLQEQKRIADNEKKRALEERQRLDAEKRQAQADKARYENELMSAKAQKNLLESELNYQKYRKPTINILEPFPRPVLSDYWTRERIKQDLRDELAFEKRKEQEQKAIARSARNFSRAMSPRKSRSKSKQKKSKSRSKSRKR